MKNRFFASRLFLPAFLIALLVMAGCQQPEEKAAVPEKETTPAAREATIDRVLKTGVLKVGLSTFVPWAMTDKTGNLIGFEVDVARKLAGDMGVKVEFIQTKWDGIIPALLSGKFDVIIGGMTIRPDRNFKVNFTVPYDYSGMTICAHKTLAKGMDEPSDFNRPDVKIGIRLGTTATAVIQKHMPQAQLFQFDDESQLYQELLNGNIHAVVASLPTPAYQALKYPDKLFALTTPFTKELIGFAVNKGDYDTINYFNNWIIQAELDGFLQERHRYWFETRDWEDQIQ